MLLQDFISILKICIGIIGSFYLVKGILLLKNSEILNSGKTFWGANYHIISSFMEQKIQYTIGIVFILGSYVLEAIAFLWGKYNILVPTEAIIIITTLCLITYILFIKIVPVRIHKSFIKYDLEQKDLSNITNDRMLDIVNAYKNKINFKSKSIERDDIIRDFLIYVRILNPQQFIEKLKK